jgi:DNA-binding NarL/FixJ family response regulator
VGVFRERKGFGTFPNETEWRERAVAPARERLSPADFAAAVAAGRSEPLTQIVSDVLAMGAQIAAPLAPGPAPADALTWREMEVLGLLVEGRTNQQIADALFITPRTARAHVAAILAKLGVATRAGAVSYAHRHQLV